MFTRDQKSFFTMVLLPFLAIVAIGLFLSTTYTPAPGFHDPKWFMSEFISEQGFVPDIPSIRQLITAQKSPERKLEFYKNAHNAYSAAARDAGINGSVIKEMEYRQKAGYMSFLTGRVFLEETDNLEQSCKFFSAAQDTDVNNPMYLNVLKKYCSI